MVEFGEATMNKLSIKDRPDPRLSGRGHSVQATFRMTGRPKQVVKLLAGPRGMLRLSRQDASESALQAHSVMQVWSFAQGEETADRKGSSGWRWCAWTWTRHDADRKLIVVDGRFARCGHCQ